MYTSVGPPGGRLQYSSEYGSEQQIVPQQHLQLRVQESQQCPPADDLSVAVAERAAAVAEDFRGLTLGSRGQRDDPGRSEVKSWKRT